MDLLDRLLGHDRWTTTQLLERCRELRVEQWTQPFDLGHQPTTLLKSDNPAHDRRTIRLTIAPHPGGQIPCGEWHGILRCHSEPSNRCVDADSEGIMGKGDDESIWNQHIAMGALRFPTAQCTWRGKSTRSFYDAAVWSRICCVYHESYPHDLHAGDCRRPSGVVH